MDRILGLDYGSVTVGVAITDPLGLTAQPLTTITRKEENKLRRTLAEIAEIVEKNQVSEIVVGLPLNMDGSKGERAEAATAFKEKLESRVSARVYLQDERLTTVEAEQILDETGFAKDRAKRKEVIDQIAAQLILEEFMKNRKGN